MNLLSPVPAEILQLYLLRAQTCCQSWICFVLGCLGRFSLSNVLTESVGWGPLWFAGTGEAEVRLQLLWGSAPRCPAG